MIEDRINVKASLHHMQLTVVLYVDSLFSVTIEASFLINAGVVFWFRQYTGVATQLANWGRGLKGHRSP